MPENVPYAELENSFAVPEPDQEKSMLLVRTIELERELMKARRTEKVLHEMEQRYLSLMDSEVFLYFILAPSGLLRLMNRRSEEFLGFQLKFGVEVTLQSLSGPGYTSEVDSMLKTTLEKSSHATMPLIRADGTPGWLEMELTWTTYQGEPSIQILASDISDLMKGTAALPFPAPGPRPSGGDSSPSYAFHMLNCCPGLLCFAVDRNGILLYATRGYREVARRFLGHDCACGHPYPVNLDTAFDMELHELIQDAFLGNTSMTMLVEKGTEGSNRWNVTAAPLSTTHDSVSGAVIHLTPLVPDAIPVPAAPSNEFDLNAGEMRELQSFLEKYEFSQLEFLNAIHRMFVVLDDEGVCVEANACFLRMLKEPRENVVGHAFAGLVMENDPVNEKLADRILRIIKTDSTEEIECKISTGTGEILLLGLNASPIRWGIGGATLISCVDNTRLRRTEEQLKRMSATDSSTGTLNRQGMERALGTEIERAARYKGSLALIMLDIDGFRQLNERVGYAASDRVLKEMATSLKGRIRSTDFLGRWGSDEFMILTPSPIVASAQLAEKLRDMVEHQTFAENVHLTLSAGVAEFRRNMDVSAFVACAYDAMTEAKRSGGNRSVQARQPEADETLAAVE